MLRRVIALNPDNGAALNYLGYTFAELGENLDEAEALVRKALVLHPNDGFFIDSLGWIFYQRGDYPAAVTELERAASLAGSDPVISEHLADAYRETDRNEEALRIYRDCEARTDDGKQRSRVQRKIKDLTGQPAVEPL